MYNKNISKILEKVKNKGDKAVTDYTYKFDKIRLSSASFRLTPKQVNELAEKTPQKLKTAIKNAARNIEYFHKQEYQRIKKTWQIKTNGKILGQIINPVDNLCVYIAGGKYAFYPSIVLMSVIPAKIAGVKNITITTPPNNITPSVMYAAKITGVNTVYRIGGPQAVAAFAFGTKTIPKADMIVGPGSSYVTESKRQLYGITGIDLIAGPSEVGIICDETAQPKQLAYDLLSQIEHSPDARGYLFCSSVGLINKVKKLIEIEIKENRSSLPYLSLKKQLSFYNCSTEKAVEEVNKIAPEHLQIIHKKESYILSRIKNAGAVFLGKYTPVVTGDYYAGPSHTLPTNGTARFSSGLSVQTFLKKISVIRYSQSALIKDASNIQELALSEGLKMHAKSIKVRVE